jgi:hypothetical protein
MSGGGRACRQSLARPRRFLRSSNKSAIAARTCVLPVIRERAPKVQAFCKCSGSWCYAWHPVIWGAARSGEMRAAPNFPRSRLRQPPPPPQGEPEEATQETALPPHLKSAPYASPKERSRSSEAPVTSRRAARQSLACGARRDRLNLGAGFDEASGSIACWKATHARRRNSGDGRGIESGRRF